MGEIRDAYETERSPIVISGCIGPRGDGYDPGKLMSAGEAQAYHAWQVGVLRDAGADFVSAFTMNNINEALGVVHTAGGRNPVRHLLHGRNRWSATHRR